MSAAPSTGSGHKSGSGAAGRGVVLASYGRGVLVQTQNVEGNTSSLRCSLEGRNQRIVCGDQVSWHIARANDGASVASVAPRRNLIERIDSRGRAEPVAANVDRLAIVAAPEPPADWFLVDRYWAGAELKEIATLLIVNKADLVLDALQAELASYRQLGLRCVEMTTRSGTGLDLLHSELKYGVTLLVGQSGVGKSSIVNSLVPNAAAQTAELTRDAEGRHTTTTARYYRLGTGAAIIDAPGVRDFAPPASLQRAAQIGFKEIYGLAAQCRFNDCQHLDEPGCAIQSAVRDDRINARRYESYRRLFRLYEKLAL